MDGLLIDSEPLWFKAFQQAFKEIGVEISEDDMREVRGHRNNESVDQLYHKHKIQNHNQEETVSLIMDDMVELIKQEGKLLPGVHQTLDICREAGLNMAVASSSYMRIINTVMDAMDLRGYFEEIYSAENEDLGKPHPGVFIATAKLLDVEPRYCLVFEDAPAGVLAAKAAKMHCIAVPEPEQKDHKFIKIADIILDSLNDLTIETIKSL